MTFLEFMRSSQGRKAQKRILFCYEQIRRDLAYAGRCVDLPDGAYLDVNDKGELGCRYKTKQGETE